MAKTKTPTAAEPSSADRDPCPPWCTEEAKGHEDHSWFSVRLPLDRPQGPDPYPTAHVALIQEEGQLTVWVGSDYKGLELTWLEATSLRGLISEALDRLPDPDWSPS